MSSMARGRRQTDGSQFFVWLAYFKTLLRSSFSSRAQHCLQSLKTTLCSAGQLQFSSCMLMDDFSTKQIKNGISARCSNDVPTRYRRLNIIDKEGLKAKSKKGHRSKEERSFVLQRCVQTSVIYSIGHCC